MKFTKMQAMGNDFVYIELFTQSMGGDLSEWARFLSDRRFGVGADGMILICPSDTPEFADFRMRVFNPDGTEAEMCGNALRGAGMFMYEKGFTDKTELMVETLGGVKKVYLETSGGHVANVTANVGKPEFGCPHIPVDITDDVCVDYPLEIAGRIFDITAMSFGNPWCVSFVDDVAALDLELYGWRMENHALFPNKVNAEFAEIIDRTTLKVRTWERGIGETYACGLGCCAALTAGVMLGLTEHKATCMQRGGNTAVEMNAAGELLMTAPSRIVFDGEIADDMPQLIKLQF